MRAPGSTATGTVTTVTEHAVTVVAAEAALLDRVLSPPVILLLQLGVALLASFVLGAIAQRVLLGRYAFSFGPLEVPDITEEAVSKPGDKAIAALRGVVPVTAVPTTEAVPADPNVQLVSLRIEIEKRLRRMAELLGLPSQRSAGQLARQLVVAEVLPGEVVGSLLDLINIGNQAAHGAEVSAGAGEWAQQEGLRLLGALDGVLRELPKP